MSHVVHRFHSSVAAVKVMQIAQSLTNGKLYVSLEATDDKECGQYAICVEGGVDIWDMQRLNRCIDQAIQLALADELAKYNPSNVMLSVWHLKQENRNRLARYNLEFKKLWE